MTTLVALAGLRVSDKVDARRTKREKNRILYWLLLRKFITFTKLAAPPGYI